MKFGKIIPAVLLALPLAACGGDSAPTAEQASTEKSQITLVSVTEANALIKGQGDLIILDVRTPEEFSSGHMEKAQNIDFKAADFAEKLKKLDKSKSYIVHCASGNRSGKATAQTSKLGFENITDIDGGIKAWKGANLPLVM